MPVGRWTQLQAARQPVPPAAWGLAASSLVHKGAGGPSFIMFGGELLLPQVGSACSSDVWLGELHASMEARWQLLAPARKSNGPGAPGPRRQHAISKAAPTEFLLVGGVAEDGRSLPDVWILHTSVTGGGTGPRAAWSRASLAERWSPALARSAHSLTAIEDEDGAPSKLRPVFEIEPRRGSARGRRPC